MADKKSVHEVMAAATPEQIRRWWECVQNGEWPTDMPVPLESFSCLWHPLQKRFIALPPEDKKDPIA